MSQSPVEKEATAQAKTPRKTQLMMAVTASSTPSTSTGYQKHNYRLSDHSPKSYDDAIQRAVDEQLFRELNGTVPPEFRDDGHNTAAAPGLSALEVAESRAQQVLDEQLATSTASCVVSSKIK